MMQRRSLMLALAASALAAACGGGDSSSFEPASYSGTLSGSGGGSFNYTVQDSAGNAAGSATVAGKSFTLAGYITSSGSVALQFQGQSAYNGWITGSQSGSGMSGSWYVSGNSNYYEGSAAASKSGGGSSGGSCSSLIGYWTENSAGLNHWNFISSSQAQVIQASTNYANGVLTTDLAISSMTGSSITYKITNQKMTGTGSYDYSYTQAQMIAQGLNVGPFSATYTLANCQLTIGGQTYSR